MLALAAIGAVIVVVVDLRERGGSELGVFHAHECSAGQMCISTGYPVQCRRRDGTV